MGSLDSLLVSFFTKLDPSFVATLHDLVLNSNSVYNSRTISLSTVTKIFYPFYWELSRSKSCELFKTRIEKEKRFLRWVLPNTKISWNPTKHLNHLTNKPQNLRLCAFGVQIFSIKRMNTKLFMTFKSDWTSGLRSWFKSQKL